ncbi:MAG: type III secretion inner membrane ring lipoprotein SctJ [Pseudoruegeria sp.]
MRIQLFCSKRAAQILLFVCALTVAGCKEVLYSNLDEMEVNQMVAVLQAAEVPTSRNKDVDGMYEILVETAQIGVAVLLLQEEGLPRQKFASLGEIFADTGIVGTPFEERARFMHAMNQEMASTISAIDGVREARVHVVLPESARFDREGKRASAAVAIYYNEVFDAQQIVPTVKTMMAHSVPELNYDDVAVSLFAVGGAQLHIPPTNSFISMAEASPLRTSNLTVMSRQVGWNPMSILTATLIAIIALIIATSLFRARRQHNKNSGAKI